MKLTVEDVIPKWLVKARFSNVEFTDQSAISGRGEEYASLRYRTGRPNLRVKQVCNECNNQWMSRLEGAARPILIPIFDGKRASLSDGQQRILAAWAFKTALIYQFTAAPGRMRIIPSSHYRYLYLHGTPPDDVSVWLGRCRVRTSTHNYLPYDSVQLHIPTLERDKAAHVLRKRNVYLVTFLIEELVFHIFGVGPRLVPNWRRLGPWDSYFSRIWPVIPIGAEWPPAFELLPTQLDAFVRRIGHNPNAPPFLWDTEN